jgi:L-2-hydroxyglutarate oxidase LhgO
MERFEITIIGAGVVGLAVASEIPSGNNLVIERHETFGRETSSRNSEVIHAGIYYPTGFLKSKLCVEGNRDIYSICRENNINHKNITKIIVAENEGEERDLEKLYKQGINNDVMGLRLITRDVVKKLEPNINAISGIFSPTTGILDTHSLMRYFELKAKNRGVTFAYSCELIGAEKTDSGYKISVKDSDGEIYSFFTHILINCAGLNSDKVANMLGLNEYKLYYCKGEYFKVGGGKGKYLNRLVYPHPTATSLGVHTVLDLQGQLKLGPNAFYTKEINYDVNTEHLTEMYESAHKFLPFIEKDDLAPDMSGIRPKIQKEGEPMKDFVIKHEYEKGLEGFINLVGLESPALTSSPAIAKYVASLIDQITR